MSEETEDIREFEPSDETDEFDVELLKDFEPENEPEYINHNKGNFKDIIDFEPLLEEQENSHNNVNKIESVPSDKGGIKSIFKINKSEKLYNQNLRETSNNSKINIDKDFQLEEIKNKIKQINWIDISNNWIINYRVNQYSDHKIQLDPKKDCSRINPLYKHKKWLETVYNNKELNLTDQLISEVCGVHLDTIQNWRKTHGIPAKNWTNGKWVEERGYIKILMPKGYLHPELVPNKGRNVRFEHVIVMEKYLSTHPTLEWSKEFLIDGKYLKTGTIAHHINFKKSDNRLENLWLYENIESHKRVETTLNECFRDLIKLNQIEFKNGLYYLNTNFDCRKLRSSKIKEILKPISINPYKDINLVKEEIKKINWNEISDDWIAKIGENPYSEKEILLDPYSDCSDENPLYLHKQWVERLVYDKNFNLTQRRLAKVCDVDRGVIFYWSKVKHNINMENAKRGFGKRISSGGRVWMKVPEDYKNPIARKNKGWMYEHRYIIERYLTNHPELDWSKNYLINGKYLKSKCIVHHINFDPLDNRLENLWISKNNTEHRKLETSLNSIVDDLLRSSFIAFRNGKYKLNLQEAVNY